MTLRKRIWLIPSLLAFACTTVSERQAKPPVTFSAPEWRIDSNLSVSKQVETLQSYLEKDSSLSMKWWVRYQQARLATQELPEKSCEWFTWLSKEHNFPLKEVSLLRALESCQSSFNLVIPNFEQLRKSKWLRDLSIQIEHRLAKKSGNAITLMNIYHDQSKWSLNRKEKIRLTQKAKGIASQLGDQKSVEKFERRLTLLSPRLRKVPTKSRLLSIANDHRYHREFDQARKIYHSIIENRKSSTSLKYSAYLGIRKSHKLQRDRVETLNATKKLAHFTYKLFRKSPKKHAQRYKKSILLYARTLWTQGLPKEATNLLRGLASELKGLTPLDQVYWVRGRIEEEAKRFHSATRWFNRALKECSSKCSTEKKILWYKSWNLKKTRQFDLASATLTELYKKSSEDEKPKVLFWQAKVYIAQGKEQDGKRLFAETIETDRYGYYGLMAQRELNSAVLPLTDVRKPTSLPARSTYEGTFSTSEDGTMTSWLLAVGEKTLARKYLNQITPHLLKEHRNDFKLWNEVFNLYARAEAYQSIRRVLWKITPATRQAIIQQRPEVLFPRPYDDIVRQAAENHGIPSELIYSIMRQESAFDRQARSPADAFGLMQLIPSLAKVVSRKEQIPYRSPEDLFQPKVNIHLGSAHLKELWDKYNGQFVLLTSSYNASERAIRQWVKHRYAGDPLQFIEDIPYQETKKYVKLVLRNFVLYKRLKFTDQKMPFPEWCLQNIQHQNI